LSKETDIIDDIVIKLREINRPRLDRPQRVDKFEMPSWISVGSGKQLFVNNDVNLLFIQLADQLLINRPHLEPYISSKDWSNLVRNVLGHILGDDTFNNSNEIASDAILNRLNLELERTNWNYGKRTFIFGCSLVDDIVPALNIGPVTIDNRASWLDKALEGGKIKSSTYKRISSRWLGNKIGRRKPSLEQSNERDILDSVGSAPYICSVTTEGVFGEIAKDKALLAARLALLGVALMWASPSKALKDINLVYDGPPYRQTYTFFQDRREFLGGSQWVNTLHGLSLFDQSWEDAIFSVEKYLGCTW